MTHKLFKVILTLNSIGKELDIDLDYMFEAIKSAKDDFNSKLGIEKRLCILNINEDYIECILKINMSLQKNKKIHSRSILGFINRIYAKCKDFDDNYSSKYFGINTFEEIKPDECRKLVDELAQDNAFIYDQEDALSILEGINFNLDNSTESREISRKNDVNKEEKFQQEVPKKRREDNNKEETNDEENTSFRSIEDELDELIGLEQVKEQIKDLIRLIHNTQIRNKRMNIQSKSFYNILIGGEPGTGKDTIANIVYNIFCKSDLIEHKNFIKIEGDILTQWRVIENNTRNYKGGVIYLDGMDSVLSAGDDKGPKINNQMNNLIKEIEKFSDRYIFIFSVSPEGIKKILKNSKLENSITFQFNIPPYSTEELIHYGQLVARKLHYSLDQDAKSVLGKHIEAQKATDKFENLHTVKRLLDNAIINNAKRIDYSIGSREEICTLGIEDFEIEKEDSKESESCDEDTAFDELESMIGMQAVKERVKEIADYVLAQIKRKELGINIEPLCLHMEFTGNPGTGKTTVARIMGKLFHCMGILEKEKFVEVTREDLVASFIGQTATKTSNKIKEAMGGVLFIDEAYSLWSDSERDFGYEAVTTLIKKMEDHKDQLVVILAGYNKEMEKLMNMNPGLKDRIQFKLEFPDYTSDEMVEIFIKFTKDKEYVLDKAAEFELLKIFRRIYKNKGDNFSNARLVRKCFDRVKISQARRIVSKNLLTKEEAMRITKDDIKSLYHDEDIKIYVHQKIKKTIGFSA